AGGAGIRKGLSAGNLFYSQPMWHGGQLLCLIILRVPYPGATNLAAVPSSHLPDHSRKRRRVDCTEQVKATQVSGCSYPVQIVQFCLIKIKKSLNG
ncbi:MAG: hypothetical protein KKH95_09095, partial [Gammaproteobacteria bacterium]|nr:hypothetical protein [Gammaproteobacteria bacterium]